jgi:PAS domain S-box-containing protein
MHARDVVTPVPYVDAASWRGPMLSRILRVSAWLGVVACVPSILITLQTGLLGVAALDASVLVLVVALYRLERIPYRWRAALFCVAPFALGIALLGIFGVYGQLFLIACAVLTSLLLGTRAGLIASGMGAVALAAAGLLDLTGPEQLLGQRANLKLWWLVIATNFALISSVLSVAVGLVMSRLEQALGEEIVMREAAAQQRELLRTFVDAVPDVVFSKDAQGRFKVFNHAALALVGLTHEQEMADKTVFDFYPPELAEKINAEDMAVIAGREILNREVTLHDGDGTPQWYLTMKVPSRDPSGTITGLVGISRNITDRKQLEEQLRQAQKMKAVGQLAGGVAHDFNNLLTVILGFSDVLRADAAAQPALLESVDAIDDAAERAARLTRQLLAFSRQTLLQPKVLDLNATISDTGRMLSRLIGANIHFSLVLDPSISRVRVDPGQLDQVLMNLAVNARDAMPDGGALTIATHQVQITKALAAPLETTVGPHVVIEVTDTGIGMSAQVMEHIFEPFYTTKGPGSGTGLGLATVFGIVRQSGGSIGVASEPGTGSTFRIYLPVVAEALAQAEAVVPLPMPRGTETLLLVEDEAGVRELARRNLTAQGYDVLTASDGRDALTLVESRGGDIALLLTDVVMPNMSGPELVTAVHQRWPAIRVIYTSGYTSSAVVQAGVASSEVLFLQKPYAPTALLRMVRTALDAVEGATR